jgi:hypothetical protein
MIAKVESPSLKRFDRRRVRAKNEEIKGPQIPIFQNMERPIFLPVSVGTCQSMECILGDSKNGQPLALPLSSSGEQSRPAPAPQSHSCLQAQDLTCSLSMPLREQTGRMG